MQLQQCFNNASTMLQPSPPPLLLFLIIIKIKKHQLFDKCDVTSSTKENDPSGVFVAPHPFFALHSVQRQDGLQ
jgi:hypothetical protein